MNVNPLTIKVLLASKSPRRRELLKMLDVEFEIVEADVEESFPSSLAAEEVPIFLAKKKATALEEIPHGAVLLTSDTIVVLDEEIIGKPVDRADAFRMLTALSGRSHRVITGVCLKSSNREIAFADITEVHFRELSESEINYYLEHYKPYDKAGSYGIQEWIGAVAIDRINGCFYNVMGLPVRRVYEALTSFEASFSESKGN